MEKISNNIELFDRYLNGDLSVAEIEAFSERLLVDDAFREAFQLYEESISEIHKAGFRQQLNGIMNQEVSHKNPFFSSYWFRGMAAAVVLLLTVTGIYYLNFNNPHISYEPYPNILKFRTDKESIPGLRDYSSGDYTLAIDKMESLGSTSDTARFYLAMSYMMIDNNEKAIKTLRDIPEGSTFQQQKNWYLGVLYFKEEDMQNALSVLNMIKEEDFKFAEAQTLIRSIE
tara:strand:- start:5903 stop:6589 length:687 start_codon:yes stop_codon:yes gene_type:complete